ncbi:MAG: CCA tRNA nucleotidyltransferase [bacterium]|nr:CCA tRNA nucleotidyltransferase [bacterium]
MSEMRAGPLRKRLRSALGSQYAGLRVLIEEAARVGARIWLVGGPVRDLLLERPVVDVDVLLSDQLAPIARALAKRLNARALVRARFLTATIECPGVHLDLSRARSERYASPGALPSVKPADLLADLPRRDFSINAMALPLNSHSGAWLVDPLGGLADLDRRRLRVLHDRSFADDPTRLLRAARYAARLGFRLERSTRDLVVEALSERQLDRISGDRVQHELERLLLETSSARAAGETERLGILSALVRGWSLETSAHSPLGRFDRLESERPAALPDDLRDAGLRLLVAGQPKTRRTAIAARLGWHGRPAEAIEADVSRQARRARTLSTELAPGRLDALLAGLSEPALLSLRCSLPAASARRLDRYVDELRCTPDPIDGHTARRWGARGPEIGGLLRSARRRSLDGQPVNIAWARRWLAGHRRMG